MSAVGNSKSHNMGFNETDRKIIVVCIEFIFVVMFIIITYNLYKQLFIKNHPYQIAPTKFITNITIYSCLCFIIHLILRIIYDLCTIINTSLSNNFYAKIFIDTPSYMISEVGIFFYFTYLILFLQLQRNNNKFIRDSIKQHFLELAKCANIFTCWLHFVSNILFIICYYKEPDDYNKCYSIPYNEIYDIVWIFFTLSIVFGLFLLYIKSLHLYKQYFCRLDNDIHIDEMQHEQLIIITRYCVVFIISVTVGIIDSCFNIVMDYIFFPKYKNSPFIYNVLKIIDGTMGNMYLLTQMIVMYSSYEFGYYQYRRFCGQCHNCMYKLCQYWTVKQNKRKWGDYIAKQQNRGYSLMEN